MEEQIVEYVKQLGEGKDLEIKCSGLKYARVLRAYIYEEKRRQGLEIKCSSVIENNVLRICVVK